MSWIAVGTVAVGVVGGVMSSNAQEDQQDAASKENRDAAQLTTQRQIWLAEQQRKYQLEDKATDRNQKRADIGVFQNYQSNVANYKPSENLWQTAADNTQAPTWDPTQLNTFAGTLPQFGAKTNG